MFRIFLTILTTVFCLSFVSCAEDPPTDVLGPDAAELAASQLALEAKSVFVNIVVPRPTGVNPAEVPPIFNATWSFRGADELRWILLSTSEHNDSWDETLEYIRNHPDAPEWTEWVQHNPRTAENRGWMSWESPPTDFGAYVFAVVARNPMETTDIQFNYNAVRILVSNRTTGPLFKVFNRYIGTIVTATTETPATVLDLASGVPMSFTLSASAEVYGGIVVGYRYGWDITDPEDDSQWDIDFTPFTGVTAEVPPRTFFFGTHSFHAEVIDNYGFKSRVPVVMNVVPAVMDRPLLVVDDWNEGPNSGFGPTNGALPSDAEHDAFWLDMVGGVEGFDPSRDVLEIQGGQPPSLDVLMQYKNIIWNAPGSYNSTPQTALSKLVRWIDPSISVPYGPVTADYIAMYMAAGGHVMLCGGQIMTTVINRVSFQEAPPVYPLIYRYELGGDQDGYYGDSDIGERGVGDHSLAYSEACLNVLDIAYVQTAHVRRPPNQQPPPGFGCPVNEIRDHVGRTDGLRTTLPIDVWTGSGFPMLGLRPEVAGDPTKWFHESRTGLNSDIYNPSYFSDMTACALVAETDPPRECFQPIYGNECLNGASVIYGAAVAFWTTVFENRVPDVPGGVAARSTIWGFDPVYFNPGQVAEAMDIVLFDEWQLPRTPFAQGAGKRIRSLDR